MVRIFNLASFQTNVFVETIKPIVKKDKESNSFKLKMIDYL